MDFLPYKINFKDVYAGFWPRFSAGFIDFLILMPLSFLSMWIKAQSLYTAIIFSVPLTLFFTFWHVFFNARYGATPGKLALKIKIVKPNGTPIDWWEAVKRQVVFFAFGMIATAVQMWAFLQMDPIQYEAVPWKEQAAMISALQPSWFFIITIMQLVWMLTDIIVFFSNKRRRAAHDYIAGTVVVHKQFAQKMGSSNNRAENEGKIVYRPDLE